MPILLRAQNILIGSYHLWFHDANPNDCYDMLRGAFLHREAVTRLAGSAGYPLPCTRCHKYCADVIEGRDPCKGHHA